MDYGAILLGLGVACTLVHVIADLVKLREHVRHPRDWFVALSAPALIGHLVLTGELHGWLQWAGVL